jgi:hypothetical protein
MLKYANPKYIRTDKFFWQLYVCFDDDLLSGKPAILQYIVIRISKHMFVNFELGGRRSIYQEEGGGNFITHL